MVWGGWLQRDWELGTHRGTDRVNDQEGQYTVALAYHPSTQETKIREEHAPGEPGLCLK